MNKTGDLTGQIFGKLTVLEEAIKRKNNRYWRCQCECGEIVETFQGGLLKGTASSCGCRDGSGLCKIGDKYGHWTILSQAESKDSHKYWLCKCRCGTIKKVIQGNLRAKGIAESCNKCKKKGKPPITHGLTNKHRLYSTWVHMRERCNSTTNPFYHNYGGRGIKVCERWDDFLMFIEDMDNTYQKGLSLDRTNNNKGYSPDNCRWATSLEQGANMRVNVFIEYKGEKMILAEFSRRVNLSTSIVSYRNSKGWTAEEIIRGCK